MKDNVKWFLYFVVAEEVKKVKIGITTDIKHRIREMQVGCPIDLSVYAFVDLFGKSNAFKAEKKAHDVFRHHHHRGEWFHFTEECKSLIHKQLQFCKSHQTMMSPEEERANVLLERVMELGPAQEEPEFGHEDDG